MDRVVKFSLWEPPCHSGIDPSDLWGSLALPTRSGFSTRQFVAALDLLCSGLEHAFAAAVEVGMADPVECPSNQEALSHGI